MRRGLIALASAVVLSVATVGIATATDPLTITIKSASLVANGAAVDVIYDVTCQPSIDSTSFVPDMGSRVAVDQAVTKKTMTHASSDLYGPTYTCDGTTVNTVTTRLVASDVPFGKGLAIVTIRLNLVEYTYWGYDTGQTSLAVRLTK